MTSFRLVPVRAQRNTNEGVVRVRHVLDDDIEVAVFAPTPEGKTEVHASVAAGVPDVSAKCSLLKWVEQYETRDDECSLAAHRRLFDGHPGDKVEVRSPEQATALLDDAG